MTAHARLSPSNHRWPNCPGSVREEAVYPDVAGEAAIDGTGTHLLLELYLTGPMPVNLDRLVGQTIGVGHEEKPEGWVVDKARNDRVKKAFEYLKVRQEQLGSMAGDAKTTGRFTERKVDIGGIYGRDDWWGTSDLTFVLPEYELLEVIDYKDGRMFVEAENNDQLIEYALGKLAEYHGYDVKAMANTPLKTIRMTIIQPKIESNWVRWWEITAEELFEHGTRLCGAAAATDDPNAPLCVGDWCQWCKHKPTCQERVRVAGGGIAAMTTVAQTQGLSLLDALQTGILKPSMLSEDQLSNVLDSKPVIGGFMESCEEEVLERLQKGQYIPGYDLGKGPGKTTWKEDEKTVSKKLAGVRINKQQQYPTKFITPAQVRKADLTPRQLKRLEDELMQYVEGKVKVVRSTFKQVTPEEMFKDAPTTSVEVVSAEEAPASTGEKKDFSTLSFL